MAVSRTDSWNIYESHGSWIANMWELDPYNHVCVRQLTLLMKKEKKKKGRKKACKRSNCLLLFYQVSLQCLSSHWPEVGVAILRQGSISHSPLERSNPFEGEKYRNMQNSIFLRRAGLNQMIFPHWYPTSESLMPLTATYNVWLVVQQSVLCPQTLCNA